MYKIVDILLLSYYYSGNINLQFEIFKCNWNQNNLLSLDFSNQNKRTCDRVNI